MEHVFDPILALYFSMFELILSNNVILICHLYLLLNDNLNFFSQLGILVRQSPSMWHCWPLLPPLRQKDSSLYPSSRVCGHDEAAQRQAGENQSWRKFLGSEDFVRLCSIPIIVRPKIIFLALGMKPSLKLLAHRSNIIDPSHYHFRHVMFAKL